MPEENKPKKKWYKRWWAFVIYFFIFISIVASAGESEQNDNTSVTNNEVTAQEVEQPSEVKENIKPKGKSYQQVFAFSGNGAKKSEPFIISGSRFKIKYDCKGELCQAFLHNTESEFDLEVIMNTTDSVVDETIIYGKGEYYIQANTMGTYTMIVEDYR